jgi:hypothetical protein
MSQSSGRFWSMDTFEGDGLSPMSLHKYNYAVGDPVDYTDPSGQAVYVGIRPMTIKFGGFLAAFDLNHVYLAFTGEGVDPTKWSDLAGTSSLITFSFHPWVVCRGEDGNFFRLAAGTESCVAYNNNDDLAAFDQSKLVDGDRVEMSGQMRKIKLSNITEAAQFEIFKAAQKSRDKINSEGPDAPQYCISQFNCGSWVQSIIRSGESFATGGTIPVPLVNWGAGTRFKLSFTGPPRQYAVDLIGVYVSVPF